ncbi:ligand-gated channel protein [Photobacterium aquimaris]|uniref:TonB-dependent siderophore receptor n=1 Tax=Photobacterium aquimaris TaxID=512643 RepID=UPI0007F024E5|nr:TonB-dependent siderophore receptor [Photobacterium aquimaris]OBU16197.1 ligand-gated channel protein [Photobacterium aquimaris]PSW02400.1 TonB-dependent siderophore receptor [Photobacterium aquimaris]
MFSKSQLTLLIGAVLSAPIAHAEITNTDEHMVVTGRDYGYKADTNSTAMRMEMTQLETPGQVTVIDEKLIDEQRASTLGEVLKNDSSISEGSKSTNRERFYLRGFELSSSTGFLRDGVQHWSHYRQPVELLERVEVLKGPSGLLYGQSAPGGLVNMVSKKPTYDTQVKVSQDIGSNNHSRTVADVSGSLNADETLRARAVVAKENKDSWRTRFDGSEVETDRFVGGLFVDYDINDRVMLSAHIDHTNEQGDLDNGSRVDKTTGKVIDPSTVKDQQWANTDNKVTNYGVALKADLTDAWSLNSGINRQFYERQRTESDIHLDKNKKGEMGYNSSDRHDEWTFDTAFVDFTGNLDVLGMNHQLLVGMNGLHYDYKKQSDSHFSPEAGNQNGFNKPSDLNYRNGSLSHSKKKQYGLYVQDLVTLNDQWQVLGGVRFAYDNETSSKGVEKTYHNILPKMGVTYHPTENSSIYGVYSESFETVGDISNDKDLNDGQEQKPKKGKLYEVGTKWELIDNRLLLSGALFQIEQDNMQVVDKFDNDTQITTQAGKQVHKGIELSASGQITDALSVNASTTFLDAKYKNTPALEGKKPADVPEFTASVWTNYAIDNGTDVNLGIYHIGSRYGDSANTFKKDAYTRVDVGVAHTYKYDEKLDIIGRVNVENLFDTDYLAGGSSSSVVVGEGRNFMATIEFKY